MTTLDFQAEQLLGLKLPRKSVALEGWLGGLLKALDLLAGSLRGLELSWLFLRLDS